MQALNHIRASRQHSASDMKAVNEARLITRRANAALRQLKDDRLQKLTRMLNHYRHNGFPSDLQWFLHDYAEALNAAIKSALWRASR